MAQAAGNPSTWKERTCLSNIVNTMSVDDLEMQGATVSATMILPRIFWFSHQRDWNNKAWTKY